MLVKVELYGDLGKSTQGGDRKVEVEVDEGVTVAEVLEQLGVSREQTWNAALDGALVYASDVVAEGATLIVFPPIAGGAVAMAAPSAVRLKPLRGAGPSPLNPGLRFMLRSRRGFGV